MLIYRPIPNSDWVLSSSDYEAGELVTHGQSCRWLCGFSALGDALVGGLKVHNLFGSSMIGMSYEEFQKRVKEDKVCINARQAAKVGNFGFPGLAGPVRVVHQQREQGPDTPCAGGPSTVKDEETGDMVPGYKGLRLCILMDGEKACGVYKTTVYNDEIIAPTCVRCIECAARLKAQWLKQWPENRVYFKWVSDCIDRGMVITREALERWPWLQEWYRPGQRLAPGEVMQHVVGRIRGGLTAPALANGMFQALLADACRSAHRIVTRECYDSTVRVPDLRHANSVRSRFAGGPSPLFGSRAPVFQHDEILAEHRRSIAHEAATRVGEIMVDELRYFCPDLAPACAVEPCLMNRWSKGAKAKWQRGGSKPADEYDRLIAWDSKAAA